MTDIRSIFENNIKLSSYVEKAVIMVREGRCDEALGMIAESAEGINVLCDAVLNNRGYFGNISEESIGEMLRNILEAKKQKDYVLLADIYELQLGSFIGSVQGLILEKEDFLDFDPNTYYTRIAVLKTRLEAGMRSMAGVLGYSDDEMLRRKVNREAELDEPLSPEELLSKGYSVEFTSCGLMTVRAAMENGNGIYLHTNANIPRESFLLADSWHESGVSAYTVFGLGMGYHVEELAELDKWAGITVFESDINILKLYAAFSNGALLKNDRISFVYDPDRTLIEAEIAAKADNERICVHYPSMRRAASGEKLEAQVPFARIVERC